MECTHTHTHTHNSLIDFNNKQKKRNALTSTLKQFERERDSSIARILRLIVVSDFVRLQLVLDKHKREMVMMYLILVDTMEEFHQEE